ncbi:MAG: PAS domain-containing protein, partial [Bacillota bacterium]|jgi:predicted transcriptional regulator YheO|nr:PAS domain-containing protein [Bacillota bacterium]
MNRHELHPLLSAMFPVVKGIAETFGPNCEVVLHDLSRPRTSIIKIENNTVTGRKIGDGITGLVWNVLRSPDFSDDMLVNYRYVTPDGKAIKATTILIRDDNRKVIGALCINFDLTSFYKAKKAFDEFIASNEIAVPGEKTVEIDNADVVDILDYLVSKTIEEYGKLPEQMSREDKIQVVGYLDDKGLFRIKGSVNWVAEKLGTSRYTIYNYLEAARAARAMDEKR